MQRRNDILDKAFSVPTDKVKSKTKDFLSYALDADIPIDKTEFEKEGHSAPIDFTLGLAGGAYDFVKNLAQLSEKVVVPALPSDVKQLVTTYGLKPSEMPSPTFVPNTMSGKLGEIVGETAASFAIPEARATELALSTLPKVASAFLKAKPIRKAAFRGAVGGGLYGTVASQKNKTYEDIPLDIIASAVAAPVLNKILPWLLTSKTSPANLIQQAKPVMAKAASDVREFFSKGGDVDTFKDKIFDQARQTYEDALSSFKGYDEAISLGQSIMSEAGAEYDNSAITDAVEEAKKSFLASLRNLGYNKTDAADMASELNKYLPVRKEPAAELIAQFNSMNKKIAEGIPLNLQEYKSLVGIEDQIKKALADEIAGRPEVTNFAQAHNLMKRINADKRELANSTVDIKKAKMDALKNIVDNGVLQSMVDSAEGNPIVANTIKDLNKSFTEFRDKYDNLFYKTKTSDEDLKAEFLPNFIVKGAQNDKYEYIDQLFKLLPDQNAKDMVTAWVLKEAKTPKDVLKIFNSFGEKQKELLFNRMKNELEKLNLVYNKHPEIFKEEIPLFDFIKPHLGLGALGGLGYLLHSPYLSGVSVVAGLGGKLLANQLGKKPEFVRQVFERKPEFKQFNKLRRAAVAGSQSLLDLLQGSQ